MVEKQDVSFKASVSDKNHLEGPPTNFKAHAVDKQEFWTIDKTIDELFIEMNEAPLVDDPSSLGLLTGLPTAKVCYYYREAARYVNRLAVGDFSRPGAKKPVFIFMEKYHSEELISHLRQSKGNLNDIMTGAAFELFKARHRLAFYKYVHSKKFRWSWGFAEEE